MFVIRSLSVCTAGIIKGVWFQDIWWLSPKNSLGNDFSSMNNSGLMASVPNAVCVLVSSPLTSVGSPPGEEVMPHSRDGLFVFCNMPHIFFAVAATDECSHTPPRKGTVSTCDLRLFAITSPDDGALLLILMSLRVLCAVFELCLSLLIMCLFWAKSILYGLHPFLRPRAFLDVVVRSTRSWAWKEPIMMAFVHILCHYVCDTPSYINCSWLLFSIIQVSWRI